MTKQLVVGLAILALSASAASAAQHRHHHHATNPPAAVPADPMGMGGYSSDHVTYLKNLHDSGYNPKNDFNANGNLVNQ